MTLYDLSVLCSLVCQGTAGLAGLLKASLALKHSTIPPNLLFESLAPAVKPFYNNLEIATASRPWPVTADAAPRRASLNSFVSCPVRVTGRDSPTS